MKKHETVFKKDIKEAEELIKCLSPVKGEKRVVEKCHECGYLYAHRYVPYGLGRGVFSKRCLCQLTSNNVRTSLVLERKP